MAPVAFLLFPSAFLLASLFLLATTILFIAVSDILFPAFLFTRMHRNKMQDDLQGLYEALLTADDKTLLEIVRQGEKFLESQLQAGVAADQRAVTFASVVSALVSALIAAYGAAAVLVSGVPVAIGTVMLPMIVLLLLAVALAALASRPVDWCYPGNSPRRWQSDLESRSPLSVGLAGQAELYARGIAKNGSILQQNANLMTLALGLTACALIAGLVLSVILFGLPLHST